MEKWSRQFIGKLPEIRLRITARLYLAFGVVLSLLICVSLIALGQMRGMGERAEEINDRWLPSIIALNQVKDGVSDTQLSLYRFLLEPDMMLRGENKVAMETAISQVDRQMRTYATQIAAVEERSAYDAFTKEWKAYKHAIPGIIAAGNAGNLGLANELSIEATPIAEKVVSHLIQMIEQNRERATVASAATVNAFHSSVNLLIGLTIIASLIAVGAAAAISRMVSRPVQRLAIQASALAEGDLTEKPPASRSGDELGELSAAFGKMTESFRAIVTQVTMNAQQVAATSEQLTASAELTASASAQIADTVQEVAGGAGRQLDGTTRMKEAFQRMAAGLDAVGGDMSRMTVVAGAANDNAKLGGDQVAAITEQMNEIHGTTTSAAEVVEKLGRSMEEIGQIVKVIGEFAAQTNMLSLNASIEAARAGEQGRGFAVVADEVRKLASQSGEATKQIREKVEAMQRGTAEAVRRMEENCIAVQAGLTLVASSGQAFEGIGNTVEEAARRAADAAGVVDEVNAKAAELIEAVEAIAVISEQTTSGSQTVAASSQQQAATMQEIMAASQAMSAMAEQLLTSISKFKL
ncbi:methyl-accepting chemotaxis protein [Paenibacillus sp. TRM 82003]|nr:methyl-accepting chemotaxis protein [Paenibacillus sp. TRM 82003]